MAAPVKPIVKPPTARQPLRARTGKAAPFWNFPFTKQNFLYFAAGFGVIVLGFILLALSISTGWDNPLSVNVAPVVLVIGYCIIIPYGIMKYFKKPQGTE